MKLASPIILGILLPMSWLHAQNVLTVDNNPGAVAMFGNFAAAHDAAEPGDTILLAGSSTSYGTHDIFKQLHIVGPGYYLGANDVPGLNNRPATFTPRFLNSIQLGDSSGSTVTGVSMTDTRTVTVVGENVSDIVFDKVRLARRMTLESPVVIRRSYHLNFSSADWMIFEAGASGSIVMNSNVWRVIVNSSIPLSIEHCIIRDTLASEDLVSVSNTIFTNSNGAADPLSDSSASFSNCIAIDGEYLPEGGGNLNGQFLTGSNAVFDFFGGNSDDRVVLREDSPALGAGTGGADIGITGGVGPYVPGGVPGHPRLTRLVVPASATDSSGLVFEVDAQAFSD